MVQNCKLLARTIELLTTSDKTSMVIAQATGLSFYWIQQLRYGKQKVDPSVTKTVKLYEYLSGRKLEVM